MSDLPRRFTRCAMTGAVFEDVNLADVRFDDVNLSRAVFDDVNLKGSSFDNVAFASAVFRNVAFGDAAIEHCDVARLTIDGIAVADLMRVWRESQERGRNEDATKEDESMMNRLIPKIFYVRIDDGLDLFVDGLGFAVRHRDDTLVVVERDGAKAYLVEDAEFAAKDRPELAIETDTIDALYAEIAGRRPDLLHPNGNTVRERPWGAREFAVRDRTDVCVVFRQW